MRFNAALPIAAVAALWPIVLPAQTGTEQQRRPIRQVVIFGNDPCPRGSGNEVIVCARRPDNERYRVPENLRTPTDPPVQSNLQRDKEAREVAATGPQSCSPVGPGGASGCLIQEINRSRVGMDADEPVGGSGPDL